MHIHRFICEIMEKRDTALHIIENTEFKADRLRSPFLINAPYSEKADKLGLSDGELISKHASDAVILIKTRNDLQKEVDAHITRVPETTIEITHFKNWGETQNSLLLHVKPSTAEQVGVIVRAVKQLNKKEEMTVM